MKGKKVIFNIKDTYSLDYTLSPIICTGLEKFKEVITSTRYKDCIGVPHTVMCEVFPEGKEDNSNGFSDEQMTKGVEVWLSYIDSMIYAFTDKAPEINSYSFDFISGPQDGEVAGDGCICYDKVPSNKEEYDRYRADEDSHEDKVKEGLSLFSVHYKSLWW